MSDKIEYTVGTFGCLTLLAIISALIGGAIGIIILVAKMIGGLA